MDDRRPVPAERLVVGVDEDAVDATPAQRAGEQQAGGTAADDEHRGVGSRALVHRLRSLGASPVAPCDTGHIGPTPKFATHRYRTAWHSGGTRRDTLRRTSFLVATTSAASHSRTAVRRPPATRGVSHGPAVHSARRPLQPGVPGPSGRQARHPRDPAAARRRGPVAALHARRRRGLARDRGGPEAGRDLHEHPQHRRRHQRRHRRARSRRHRTPRRDAGHGGKSRAVQAVRWGRRGPTVHGDRDRRRARRRHRPGRADLRRDQPRGHLRAPLLRDRASAAGAPRDPRLP